MKTVSPLTETERQTIIHALYVAAEQFDKDAECAVVGGADRVARTFQNQAETTRRWAELIENAEEVIVR